MLLMFSTNADINKVADLKKELAIKRLYENK